MDEPMLNVPEILGDFGGVARLFPLPSIVLFPNGFAPLNVFEPRYVEMVEDALRDDGLIAAALLKPGYHVEYEGSPAIHPVACIGKIIQYRRKPNGHIELLLYGLARARIVEEVPSSPFRRAQVQVLGDVIPPGNQELVAERMRRALDLVPGRHHRIWGLRQMARQVRGVDAAPGPYADAVASESDLPGETLYEILEEVDVLKRLETLIQRLEMRMEEGAPAPAPRPADPRLN